MKFQICEDTLKIFFQEVDQPMLSFTKRFSKISVLSVFIVCFLTSCASVPLGTLLKFSTFDEEDFAEINPEHLNVRIFMQEPAQLGDGPVSLSLLLETATGPIMGDYVMQPVNAFKDEIPGGLFSTDIPGTSYLFELTPDQILRFRELQQSLLNRQIEHMTFNTDFPLGSIEKGQDAIYVWIYMAMDEKADYITLIEGARIEVQWPDSDDTGSTME